MTVEMQDHLAVTEERIVRVEHGIKGFMKQSASCQKIAGLEGIGAITATAIVGAVGDARDPKKRTSPVRVARPGFEAVLLRRH
jgi:transposase